MRKIPGIAVAALAVLAFTGCVAADAPTPTPTAGNAAKPTKTPSPSGTAIPTPTPTPTEPASPPPGGGADPADPSTWLIDAGGIGPLRLGMPLDAAVAAMPGYVVGTCPNPAVRFLRSDSPDLSDVSFALASGDDGNLALISLHDTPKPATADGIRNGSTIAQAKATYPGLLPSQAYVDYYTLDGSPGSITFQTAAVNAGDGVPIVTISVVAGGLPPRELCG
ncbi:hypothetical protein [Agromyces sp. NPDC057865]|uniref:hypothetical protein n=1 Tax=Agromyces sp. NPDC057865 TaxID=3346267 RepID=UPI003672AD07